MKKKGLLLIDNKKKKIYIHIFKENDFYSVKTENSLAISLINQQDEFVCLYVILHGLRVSHKALFWELFGFYFQNVLEM